MSRSIPLSLARLLAALCVSVASAGSFAAESAPPPSLGAWQFLRPHFYGDRELGEVDEAFMHVEAPGSTPDPAATPIALHFGKDAVGKIKQVRVIIDNNPSPVVATLDVGAGQPIAEIDFRVRVDRATSVRAIAETTDGKLEMRSAWVRAEGGCSAPPSASREGKIGDVRFRPSEDGKSLQVSVRHPNYSGFQIDPKTGDAIPPHYVSHLNLTTGGKPLLQIESGISISENPTFRIVSEQPIATPVTLEASDSKDAHFSATWNGGSPRAVALAGGTR
ncbi:MAG TPA: quinoprotein dehydrogenase-associated SoxYZ-like carrier [Rhodanobacteraceae bacterium]|jgi:sulfur-oxidizing protein SoxY